MSENRIEQGMRAELALRRRLLDGGAEPIGWKVAFNIPAVQELLGIDRPLAGFDSDATSAHLEPMVEVIADRLSDAGERLRPGDRIITGVIAPPAPVEDGDTVRLELERLGAVELTFGALQ